MGKKIGIAVGVIILVAALVVCLVPLKTVAYTTTVEYQDIETCYETEPYEVKITEPLNYEGVESYTKIVKVLYGDDFEIPGLERECKFGDPAPKGYVVGNVATNSILYTISNPAENLNVQEKVEVVRFLVPLEEWKNKGVKV